MGYIVSEHINLKILITGQGDTSLCFGLAFRCVGEVRESSASEFVVKIWDSYLHYPHD